MHVLFSHRMPLQLLCRLAKCIIFYFFSILKLQFHFCHICVILLLLSEINCVYVYVYVFMLMFYVQAAERPRKFKKFKNAIMIQK